MVRGAPEKGALTHTPGPKSGHHCTGRYRMDDMMKGGPEGGTVHHLDREAW